MSKSDHLLQQLQVYQIPGLGKTFADVQANIRVDDDQVAIQLGFPLLDKVGVQAQLAELAVRDCSISINIPHYAVQPNLKPYPQIKNIVAVASGKGGVGKSTTAVNLALALQVLGAKVGVLDADIYGPNLPELLGVGGQVSERDAEGKLHPVMAHGLQTMSIGYLVDAATPMVWRGPMVSTALQQLLRDTLWQDLDYLIVDMPPGTGDIQLTLAQKIPVTGSVIVTTPQDIALADVRKAIQMFKKVNVRVIGVAENMSYHICSACGHQEAIFGAGGGERLAAEYDQTLLGQVPLRADICQQGESGLPAVVAEPDGAVAEAYLAIAQQATAALSCGKRDFGHKFPDIVVE